MLLQGALSFLQWPPPIAAHHEQVLLVRALRGGITQSSAAKKIKRYNWRGTWRQRYGEQQCRQ
jgi:hypothetical protein